MQAKVLCDFWVPGKPQPLARPITSLLWRDEHGKNHRWFPDDPVPRLRKTIVPLTTTPGKSKGMRSILGGLGLQSRNKQQVWRPHTGPVMLKTFCMFGPNMSDSKRVRADKIAGLIPHMKHPDGDNVQKNVADALEGIIYENDKQIINNEVFKGYGPKDGVRIVAYDVNMSEWMKYVLCCFPSGLAPEPPGDRTPGPLFET